MSSSSLHLLIHPLLCRCAIFLPKGSSGEAVAPSEVSVWLYIARRCSECCPLEFGRKSFLRLPPGSAAGFHRGRVLPHHPPVLTVGSDAAHASTVGASDRRARWPSRAGRLLVLSGPVRPVEEIESRSAAFGVVASPRRVAVFLQQPPVRAIILSLRCAQSETTCELDPRRPG